MLRYEDGYSNKREQSASYTDRILYRSLPDCQSELTHVSYESGHDVFGSDHRPVFSVFQVIPRSPYTASKEDQNITVTMRCTNASFHSTTDLEFGITYRLRFSGSFLEENYNSTKGLFIGNEILWKQDRIPEMHPFVKDVMFLSDSHLEITILAGENVIGKN